MGRGPAGDAPGPRLDEAVTAFVDTNVLIRYLTGDPPAHAAKATRYLKEADELQLADLVLGEVACVLEWFYEAPRVPSRRNVASGARFLGDPRRR